MPSSRFEEDTREGGAQKDDPPFDLLREVVEESAVEVRVEVEERRWRWWTGAGGRQCWSHAQYKQC